MTEKLNAGAEVLAERPGHKPGPGHNKPPLVDFYREQNEQLPEYLAEQSPDVIKRFDDLMAAFLRTPATVDDDATNEKFTDFVNKKIAACKSALKGLHTGHKEPFLTGGKIVDNFYLRRIEKLEGVATELRKRQTEYNVKVEAKKRREREEQERIAKAAADEAARIAREEQDKADRIAREEREKADRERQAAEAAQREREARIKSEKDMQKAIELEEENKRLAKEREERVAKENAEREAAAKTAAEEAGRRQALADEAAKLADAKSVELTRTRGEQGGVSSLRTEWKIEAAEDYLDKLDLNILKPYMKVEDINMALRGWLKPRAPKQGGIPPELPGAKIWEHKFTR